MIEGVLFRARYLGSTQLVCEGQPNKSTRMMQAEEAVSRIKVRIACAVSIVYRSLLVETVKLVVDDVVDRCFFFIFGRKFEQPSNLK